MNEEVLKFIGLRVRTNSRLVTYGGLSKEVVDYDPADENIVALQNICESKGYEFRIHLPNTFCTMDHRMSRLNVYISSDDGISYVISRFSMG